MTGSGRALLWLAALGAALAVAPAHSQAAPLQFLPAVPLQFEVLQATTSGGPGRYPSSPPIRIAAGVLGLPPLLVIEHTIDLATIVLAGAEVEIPLTSQASLPMGLQLAEFEVKVEGDEPVDTPDLDLVLSVAYSAGIPGVPSLAYTPGSQSFVVLQSLDQANGDRQNLRISGEVPTILPPGSVTLLRVAATPGSLQMDLGFQVSADYPVGQPLLEMLVSGEHVPVPEPSAFWTGAAAVTALCTVRRRRSLGRG